MKRLRVSCFLFASVFLVGSLLAQEPLLSVDTDPVASAPSASVLRLIRFNGTARGAQGQPMSGMVGVTFALYAEQEGGAPLWLETQNVSPDPQGRYTALLGATSNQGLPLEVFSSGEARWLGIQVQGQAEQRILLVSVPYALKAAEAETLSGKTASDFVLSEQLSTQVEQEINTQIESQGLITSEEAGTLAQVSGSGTVGQIAKFTSPTAVGDSVIHENNGNIAIGFSNAQQKLAVGVGAAGGSALNLTNLNNQDLQVILSAAAAPDRVALIGPATPTNLALGVGGTERMRITNAGNIGIGFKTPVQRLVVASRPVGGPTVTVTNGANQDLQLSVSGRNAVDRVAMVAPSTGTNLALGVGGTEKMRITNAGNVGIGTSMPLAPLHVAGAATFEPSDRGFTIGGDETAAFINYFEPGGGSAILRQTFANTVFLNNVNFRGNVAMSTDSSFTADFDARLHLASPIQSPTLKIEGPFDTDSVIPILNLNEGFGTGLCGFQLKYLAGSNQLRVSGGCNGPNVDLLALNRSNGRLGIGTTSPADQLHVNGEARVISCVKKSDGAAIAGTCASDARLKTNVVPFEPLLEKVARLEPVHFEWRVEDYPEFAFGPGRQTGLVAQQVEAVLPELVAEGEHSFKAVRYQDLPLVLLQAIRELKDDKDGLEERTALLLKAVQEQQEQIGVLQAELESVKAQLQSSDAVQVAALNQN